MSAGVRDRIGNIVLRQVRVFWVAVEGELEDSRSRDMNLVAQCAHVRRDHSQVFRKKWKVAQLVLYCAEELGARTWHPLPSLRGGCSSRHMPSSGERTKVIQANCVHVRQQGAESIYAPAIAGPPVDLPVVHGVAPELSIGAEVVGRYAGYETRTVVIIQQEQFRVGPNIARVRRNEKGQVTNQAHTLCTCVFLELFALAEQDELSEAHLLDWVCQLSASPSQRGRDR